MKTSIRTCALVAFAPGLFALGAIACDQVTKFNGETIVGLPQPPASTTPPVASTPPPPPTPPPLPAPRPRVEVQVGRIQINEKIQFDVNLATIRAESNSLLDEIAQVIKQNPTMKKIQVEGHSSAEGDPKANVKLSDDRAKSVVAALEKRGVTKGVLTSKGFGSSVPIDTGTTEEAREKNRRVDFVILDPAPPKSGGGDAGAPTKATTTTTTTSAAKDGGAKP